MSKKVECVDNFELLDNYFNNLCIEELSIDEAKELVLKIKTASVREKEKLREKLLCGTLGEVYKFIRNNGLLTLCDTGYFEVEDVISAMVMTWALNLESKIDSVSRYSSIFNKEYFMDVAERLGISCHSEMLGIKDSCYFDCLAMYFKNRNLNDGKNVEMPNGFVSSFSTSMKKEDYLNSIGFISNSYSLYKDYEHISSKHSGVAGLMGMAFVDIMSKKKVFAFDGESYIYDEFILRSDVEEQILSSKALTDRQRNALGLKFGIYDRCEYQLDEIAEILGITYEQARNAVGKGLMNLRKDGKVLKCGFSYIK